MQVDVLDGVSVAQITCGPANTIMLVESNSVVEALPEYVPPEDAVCAPAAKGGKAKAEPKAAPAKRPAEPAAAKGKKAKK